MLISMSGRSVLTQIIRVFVAYTSSFPAQVLPYVWSRFPTPLVGYVDTCWIIYWFWPLWTNTELLWAKSTDISSSIPMLTATADPQTRIQKHQHINKWFRVAEHPHVQNQIRIEKHHQHQTPTILDFVKVESQRRK